MARTAGRLAIVATSTLLASPPTLPLSHGRCVYEAILVLTYFIRDREMQRLPYTRTHKMVEPVHS